MLKKKLYILLFIIICMLNTGCWNYIGLNEMTVVSGIAIDKEEKNYILNFEIYNLQETADGYPIKSEVVKSTGKTIFDAVRNAKKRVLNKLYFNDAKVIIVSEKIAQEDGINSILNWFIRDHEIRENVKLIVSKEKTASELLKTKGLTNTIVSTDIENIIMKDQSVTSTTEEVELYKVFNILNYKGSSLTLPAFSLVKNDNKKVCEVDGIAVFKKDKMVGYLSSEESKYYLLAKGEFKGGIITIETKIKNSDKDSQNLSLEIKESKSKIKYSSKDKNNLKIKISINTKATIGELQNQNKKLIDKDLKKIEKEAEKIVKKRILKVLDKITKKYDTDILGFGKKLHIENPKKYKKLKKVFDEKFKSIKISINTKFEVYNTGYIK